MTLNQLQYAIYVTKYGSFKYAAEKLDISQPALSMQIQKLEDEIGLRIFDRTSNPIKVTSDGELFMERAQEIVTAAHRLADFSVQLSDEYNGTIKLGIIPTLAPFLVPLFIDQLTKDFPNIKLDIHEIITEKVVNGVRSGELDAGIISTPIDVYGIKHIPIFYEKFYIYSSDEHVKEVSINLNKIKYENLWLLEEGNCFRDQINNFCDLNKIRKNKHFIYRSNSIDALIRLVDTKGGMTILPELSTLSLTEEQEENVKSIAGKKPKVREIAIIVTRQHDKERFIQKIQEYIQMNIPKSMLTSKGVEIVDPEINVDFHKSY